MGGPFALLAACGLLASGPPDYHPRAWVRGRVRCAGSETMQILLSRWSWAFAERQPGVAVEIDGRGSGAAIRQIPLGRIDFAALSREPTDAEILGSGFGDLRIVPVGWDTLRLFRRRGPSTADSSFARLFSGDSRDARAFGRNLSSGTRAEAVTVLRGGAFGPEVRSLPSPGRVEDAVEADPKAFGYGGGGWRLARSVAVGPALRVRPLVLAIPGGAWSPIVREFVAFALSKEGQEQVRLAGFRPLDPDSVAVIREGLGLGG